MKFETIGLSMAALILAVACNGPPSPSGSTTSTATATTPKPTATTPADEAATIFKQRCVVCHGDHGAGDGPGAAALNPKPRAFALAEWQSSVTDEHIAKTIVEGGAAVGKSASMAPNPDLKGKKEVVAELVKIVRKFKK